MTPPSFEGSLSAKCLATRSNGLWSEHATSRFQSSFSNLSDLLVIASAGRARAPSAMALATMTSGPPDGTYLMSLSRNSSRRSSRKRVLYAPKAVCGFPARRVG
ncbi:hypothetical protein DIPPA_00392 [Diplonema papillatum]|nr:hypothetical protein DIPPA_00392 [Diplonema papillatum]